MSLLVRSLFFLLAALLLACLLALLTRARRALLKAEAVPLIVLAVVASAVILPLNSGFFMGMEYEDAYIYSSQSRALLFMDPDAVTSLWSRSCVLGSLAECELEATLAGHFLTLPVAGYVCSVLFGYSPYSICLLNLFFSVVSTLLLYGVFVTVENDRSCGFVAALLFAATPAMSAFHSSALSEPLSSLLFLLFLGSFVTLFIDSHPRSSPPCVAQWVVLALSFALALLTKRENLVLVIVPLIALLRPSRVVRTRLSALIVCAVLAVGVSLVLAVHFSFFGVKLNDAGNIGESTFRLGSALSILPTWLSALGNTRWFAVLGPLLAAGLVAILAGLRRTWWPVFFVSVLGAYLVLYTTHYRSYDFIQSGSTKPFEALQHIRNCFPLVSLVAAFGWRAIFRWFSLRVASALAPGRWAWWAALGSIVAFSSLSGHALKTEWWRMEQEERVLPVVEALKRVDYERDIVLTGLPVIVQVFGDERVRVVDAFSIGSLIPVEVAVERLQDADRVLWLHRDVGRRKGGGTRHPAFSEFMKGCEVVELERLSGSWSLSLLTVK